MRVARTTIEGWLNNYDESVDGCKTDSRVVIPKEAEAIPANT